MAVAKRTERMKAWRGTEARPGQTYSPFGRKLHEIYRVHPTINSTSELARRVQPENPLSFRRQIQSWMVADKAPNPRAVRKIAKALRVPLKTFDDNGTP